MAQVPPKRAYRRRDGEPVVVEEGASAERYTIHRPRRRPSKASAPRHLGQPAEFSRIG